MAKAIGESLPLAVGIALSPVPIIAVVLMLTSRRANVNGTVFLLGWPVDLGAVGAIVLVLAGASGGSKSGLPGHLGQLVARILKLSTATNHA